MADKKIVRAVITGTVQGVWFRAWTIQEASARKKGQLSRATAK